MKYGSRINRIWGGRNVRHKQLRGGYGGRRKFRRGRFKRRFRGRGRRGRRVTNLKSPMVTVMRKFNYCYADAFNLGTAGDPVRFYSVCRNQNLGQWPDALAESRNWVYYRIVGIKYRWLPWWSTGSTVYDYFQRPIPATGPADVKYAIRTNRDIGAECSKTPVEMINKGARIRSFTGPIQHYVKHPIAWAPLWNGSTKVAADQNYGRPAPSPWISTGFPTVSHQGIEIMMFAEKNFAAEPSAMTINTFCTATLYVQFKRRKYIPGAVGMATHAGLGVVIPETEVTSGDEADPFEPTAYEPDGPAGGDGNPPAEPPPA